MCVWGGRVQRLVYSGHIRKLLFTIEEYNNHRTYVCFVKRSDVTNRLLESQHFMFLKKVSFLSRTVRIFFPGFQKGQIKTRRWQVSKSCQIKRLGFTNEDKKTKQPLFRVNIASSTSVETRLKAQIGQTKVAWFLVFLSTRIDLSSGLSTTFFTFTFFPQPT